MFDRHRRLGPPRSRPAILSLAAFTMTASLGVSTALAWENALKDPGFETYRLNPAGYYEPGPGSPWEEITLGRGSTQLDMNGWAAPDAMVAEQPLNFTPGTTGYEGQGPEENTGRLIIQQDIVDPAVFSGSLQNYEAWVWLGGAGRDDDSGADNKEEAGGWEIQFYDNTDTANWRTSQPIEGHGVSKDFFGEPNSFVQIAGLGKVPAGTKGARFRVWATTWGQASGPANYPTEVALDNAHFAVIGVPNMLINGDFELDDRPCEFKGWSRPAAWPFPRNGLEPLDVNDCFADNFDHGKYRPFYGARWSYGFATYLRGWPKDAFTFGQYVDNPYPDGTPFMLTFNWIQAAANGGEVQLRLIGSKVEVVVEYRDAEKQIGAEGFLFDWPVPTGKGAVARYDQNSGQPYSPRMLLNPPGGTKRIGVHVNFMIYAPYRDGFRSMNIAVDDFFLSPAELPRGYVPSTAPAAAN